MKFVSESLVLGTIQSGDVRGVEWHGNSSIHHTRGFLNILRFLSLTNCLENTITRKKGDNLMVKWGSF